MTLSDAAAPPVAEELRQWSLSADTQLRTLRSSLHEALLEFGLVRDVHDADMADDVVLVATELAANALYHGVPPTTVRLSRDQTRFVLDVVDHDPASMPQLAAASLTRSRGRGLFIAQAIAEQIGWYLAGSVKHVWAVFPITRPTSNPDQP